MKRYDEEYEAKTYRGKGNIEVCQAINKKDCVIFSELCQMFVVFICLLKVCNLM